MKKIYCKLKDIVKKYEKVSIFCLFLFLFVFGLSFLKEVGINYDEKAEQNILKMNIYAYSEFLDPTSDLVKYYKEAGLVPIYQSVERDHGISPYYIFTPFLALNKVSEHTLSFAWHLYTYLFFFIGVVFCYKLIKELWNRKTIALLTTLIYFFTPRFFADGLYNNKDCVLLSFVFMCLYFGVKFIRNKSYKDAIFFGISSAFACNLKVSGGYVFALVGLCYLFQVTKQQAWNKKHFLVGLLALFSCVLLYFFLTPAIWTGGFHFFAFLKWSLENSVNFARNYGKVFFEGVLYQHWEHPLPWYYVPKIIFLTLPVFVSLLLGIGVFFVIKNMRKKEEKNMLFLVLCLVLLFLPILAAMLTNPNIYNGWRHFYFVYAPILVLISYGLMYLLEQEKKKKIVLIFIFVCLSYNALGIIKNGTSSSMYYNFLARDPSTKYELDYYGVSATKVLQEFVKERKEPIYLYGFSDWAMLFNYESLKNTYKEKIILLKNQEELEEALASGIKPYYFYFETYDREFKEVVSSKEKVCEFKAWGNVFATIYKEKGEEV